MKFFVCIALFVVVGSVYANPTGSSPTAVNTNTNKELETEATPVQTAQLANDFTRFRKSAGYGGAAPAAGGYGAASIPAPPCPKNYLFSCQPNLAPVPCAAAAGGSYGSAGAYTSNVPTYVAPVGNTYGLPQTYNGFVPQSFNQFYQY